jgi:hypothetical protein
MRKTGKLLVGAGFWVLLGPVGAGMIALLCAVDRSKLMWFVYGAAIYVPCGLALIVAGKLKVERSYGMQAPAPTPHATQRAKQYQLALQFRGDVPADYPAMIILAQQLSVALGATATVAGHDLGVGESMIFIHTPDAHSSFNLCKPVLAQLQALEGLTAAYRPFDASDYKVLWPSQFQGRFAVG